ncbi:MAG TPA: hypothetical protein VF908_09025 [Gemmatimonadaceae bacterium]
MSILFLCAGAVFVLRGPFGRALADRIAGRARTGAEDQDVQELRGEVDDLRHQLGEVQERLDFAERLLARQDERAGALPKRGNE